MTPDLSNLLSALLGGLIAAGTAWLTNHYALRKDREQREHQAAAEREKRTEESRAAQVRRMRAIYDRLAFHLASLATLIDKLANRKGMSQDDLTVLPRHREDAQRWLVRLLLRPHPADPEFERAAKAFIEDSESAVEVSDLRDQVLRLARMDANVLSE